MKKLVFLLAAAALIMPVASHAEQKAQGSGPNPYTECGIGAALFPDTHWAAVTSNAIWDLGTTAISSAITTPESCNAKKVNTAKLILETLDSLEKDVANNGGTYTTALVQTMGCSTASHDQFVSDLRTAYSKVVATEGYANRTKDERALGMYNSAKFAAGAQSCAASL